jgi:hypothetical protein
MMRASETDQSQGKRGELQSEADQQPKGLKMKMSAQIKGFFTRKLQSGADQHKDCGKLQSDVDPHKDSNMRLPDAQQGKRGEL